MVVGGERSSDSSDDEDYRPLLSSLKKDHKVYNNYGSYIVV